MCAAWLSPAHSGDERFGCISTIKHCGRWGLKLCWQCVQPVFSIIFSIIFKGAMKSMHPDMQVTMEDVQFNSTPMFAYLMGVTQALQHIIQVEGLLENVMKQVESQEENDIQTGLFQLYLNGAKGVKHLSPAIIHATQKLCPLFLHGGQTKYQFAETGVIIPFSSKLTMILKFHSTYPYYFQRNKPHNCSISSHHVELN